jgi:hypothetical protein
MRYAHFLTSEILTLQAYDARIQAKVKGLMFIVCILIYDLCNEFAAKQWVRF